MIAYSFPDRKTASMTSSHIILFCSPKTCFFVGSFFRMSLFRTIFSPCVDVSGEKTLRWGVAIDIPIHAF